MSWKPQSLVDGATNTLWSPIQAREQAPERQGVTKPSKNFNSPVFQLGPIVTKVIAHDPIQKLLTTRFVPVRSLGPMVADLSIDPNTKRRYSIIATQSARFSLQTSRRRFRLVVEEP